MFVGFCTCGVVPPPSALGRGVAVFDRALHEALRRIVVGGGGGFGPLQDEIAALPVCMGGLGVSRGEDLRPYAFLASSLQTQVLQDDILAGWEVPVHPELEAARRAFGDLVGDFDDSQFDSPDFVRRDLQKKLGSLSAKVRRDSLLAHPAPQRLHEVLLSSSLPHASAWLHALPLPRLGQSMLGVDFSCRLRYQLCIPIFLEGSPCPCCSEPLDRWGDHAVQCRYGKGVSATSRHNAVRDVLFVMGRRLGLDVEREPHFPVRVPGAEGRRPDLIFKNWVEGKDLYVDIAGSSPLCLSNLACFSAGGAASKAVARKEASYRNILLAQPPCVAYCTFAFESFGGLHSDARGLIARFQGVVNLAALNHDDSMWYSVMRRVSFTIAKAIGRQLSSRLPWWGGLCSL